MGAKNIVFTSRSTPRILCFAAAGSWLLAPGSWLLNSLSQKGLPDSRRSIIYPSVTREIPGLRML
jgi:hypothetical protein